MPAPIVPAIASGLLGIVDTFVKRYFPDPAEADRARAELLGSLLAADRGQMAVNKAEAEHRSLFVAGWRPALGWAGALTLGWAYFGQYVASWLLVVAGRSDIALPVIPTDDMLELVLALLGIGGMRTFEKIRGVAR
jgi:hypothetical protein